MQKYELDLSEYEVEVGDDKIVYPLLNNLKYWLRSVGIFKTAREVVAAIALAKRLLDYAGKPSIKLDEEEADVLRTGLDRFIELTAEGKSNIGGEAHEEAILRVVNMKEIED